MKNRRNRFLATAIIFAMLFALLLPIINVSADIQPGIIKIKAPDSLSLEGQEFSIYQLFTVTYDDSDHYSYVITEDFKDFKFNGVSLKDYLELKKTLTAEENQELTAALMYYIKTNSIATTAIAKGEEGDEEIIIDDIPLGYYMVVGSGLAADGSEITALCSLTTTNPDAEITLKADAPTINKEVYNHNTDTWTDWTDVEINDAVDFRLTSKVPNMQGYKNYYFTVYDKMSGGLTYNPATSNLTVQIDGNDVAYKVWYSFDNITYTDTFPADYKAGDELYIAIDFINFIQYKTGDAIVITYTATLNEEAVIGADGNPNEALLEYSNNPYDTGDGTQGGNPKERDHGKRGKTPWIKVIVYTFDMGIYKFYLDKDDNKIALAGAEFKLYRDAACTDEVYLDIDAKGYFVVKADKDVTIVTPEGVVNIRGLDAGTYYLKETKAPEGFNKIDAAIKIEIKHLDQKGAYTVNNGTDAIEVENKSGIQFPETGGIGRKIFYVLGSLLTVGAGIVFMVRIKTKKETEDAA